MKLNFGWLAGKRETGEDAPNPTRRAFVVGAAALAAAGAAVTVGASRAQAWHHGHPHGPPHEKWKSNQYSGHSKYKSQQYHSHNKWKSEEYYDYHSPKRSAYRRRKYYHREYGSWGGHPQCLHLGPFGVCEY